MREVVIATPDYEKRREKYDVELDVKAEMQLIAKDPEEDDEDVGANLDQRGEAMRDAVLVEDVMEMGAIGLER